MSLIQKVKRSASFIAENASDVSINNDSLIDLAEILHQSFLSGHITPGAWKEHSLHPSSPVASELVDWIFVLDCLNFSFWNDDFHPFSVFYQGKNHIGYWGLCAALKRALDEGIPITTPEYYQNIDELTLHHVFRQSDPTIPVPLLQERVHILRESGRTLMNKFSGSFLNVLSKCKGSAVSLVDLIVDNFPSFCDFSSFKGRRVYFLKRAQILTADIHCAFEGQEPANFHDVDQLTMFADYRVPQILASIGVLKYSEQLSTLLGANSLLPHGSTFEVEIRGCAIHAVEKARELIPENDRDKITSVLIDFFLWDLAKQSSETSESRALTHRTRTIFY
ncbi:hypothetical protein RCL1_003697 [Eukaryota sp. TZLM3-RCL]